MRKKMPYQKKLRLRRRNLCRWKKSMGYNIHGGAKAVRLTFQNGSSIAGAYSNDIRDKIRALAKRG